MFFKSYLLVRWSSNCAPKLTKSCYFNKWKLFFRNDPALVIIASLSCFLVTGWEETLSLHTRAELKSQHGVCMAVVSINNSVVFHINSTHWAGRGNKLLVWTSDHRRIKMFFCSKDQAVLKLYRSLPSLEAKWSSSLVYSEGKMEREMDRTVGVKREPSRTGKAFDLPVNLRSNFHLWVMSFGERPKEPDWGFKRPEMSFLLFGAQTSGGSLE